MALPQGPVASQELRRFCPVRSDGRVTVPVDSQIGKVRMPDWLANAVEATAVVGFWVTSVLGGGFLGRLWADRIRQDRQADLDKDLV